MCRFGEVKVNLIKLQHQISAAHRIYFNGYFRCPKQIKNMLEGD
jgi:hypothetical protein